MHSVSKLIALVLVLPWWSTGMAQVKDAPEAAPSTLAALIQSTPVDTQYTGPWDVKRVYCEGKGPKGLMVPLVELDTNTYEKKFWMSEKAIVSQPTVEARYGAVVAIDSVVLVLFREDFVGAPDAILSTYSTDYGIHWSNPEIVPGEGQSGDRPVAATLDGRVFVSYGLSLTTPDTLGAVVFREWLLDDLSFGGVVIIGSSPPLGDIVFRPALAVMNNILLASFKMHEDDDEDIYFYRSGDKGQTWQLTGEIGPDAGNLHFALPAGVSVVEVHSLWSGTDIVYHVSSDTCTTWSSQAWLSASDGMASQRPAATSDGITRVHAVWYDFQGVTSGWGGYPYYRRSIDCGQSWEPIKAFCDQPYSEELDIWADTQMVYAVWNDSRTGSPNYAVYMRISHDGGDTWCPEFKIVDEADPAWDLDVYGHGDFVYFVWREQHPPGWVWQIMYRYGAWYIPGDVDMSGSIDISDLLDLVDYMFQFGPQPVVLGACQMDGIAGIDIADLVYLVTYMFGGVPPPVGEDWP